MYNTSSCFSSAELQPCSRQKRRPFLTAVLGHQLHSLFMPAVNRRVRSDASSKQPVQNCATLLSIDSHKLVKVRSIGAADETGDSQAQVRSCRGTVGQSLRHNLGREVSPHCAFRPSWQQAIAFAASCPGTYKLSCFSKVAASL